MMRAIHRESLDDREICGSSDSIRHQRFVLADPVAFSYLEEDPSVVILERSRYLEGYQCYVVEQWACSRSHPTFVVIAYTGDNFNKIKVGVLSVPADESSWSPRLKVYFRTLAQSHARRRETTLGTVLVTNLSGFPSSLTLIGVPDGDVRKHREDFVVNEDLKRLGCSGRMVISIAPPTPAAEGKFHQLYRTSEKIDLYKSVIELVKLCQAGLMLFDVLRPEYADGLLCDITEKAVNDWWTEFGYDLYKVDPSDGILGPTTVAALIGTLIGARNRLHALGAPVSKDVFDIEATKRGIGHFQRTQNLRKTRRLDRQTLESLHQTTAKHMSTEGWLVPRAVKSTVAELSGKGGEMVMDMVGRERATLAEIETTDIEQFAQLVRGERARWLWQGRARKRTTRDLFDEHPGQVTGKIDEDLGIAPPSSVPKQQQHQPSTTVPTPADGQTSATQARLPTVGFADPQKTVIHRAKGRIRGAALSGKKESSPRIVEELAHATIADPSYESFNSARSEMLNEGASRGERLDDYREENDQAYASTQRQLKRKDTRTVQNPQRKEGMRAKSSTDSEMRTSDQERAHSIDVSQIDRQAAVAVEAEISTAAGDAHRPEAEELSPDRRPAQHVGPLLHRTESYSRFEEGNIEMRNQSWWPRHISFSSIEETVLMPASHSSDEDDDNRNELHQTAQSRREQYEEQTSPRIDHRQYELKTSPRKAMEREYLTAAQQRASRSALARIGRTCGSWLLTRVNGVVVLDSIATQDAEQMAQLYASRKQEQRALGADSQEVLREEKSRLGDSVRDLETLCQRVDYEMSALRSKVEEVENSVSDFERQVIFVEDRVKELVKSNESGMNERQDVRKQNTTHEHWFSWSKFTLLRWTPQRSLTTVASETMRASEIRVNAAADEAVHSSPLAKSPGDDEL
ncbi:MAG: hypothetical protein Q9159_006541 [Coniocarpon cinnabarinum]